MNTYVLAKEKNYRYNSIIFHHLFRSKGKAMEIDAYFCNNEFAEGKYYGGCRCDKIYERKYILI
ncbi:MAG: hypothetical protein Pg6B_09760 [Candidatus Azobacteroides pseudotrichonymphae]|jgi:hypothetical protein|uniref:hypothetical protein n=1 Tax=Candidatus Azobacteroides pseudotrichonymphae TaxID=511435 RepID=UPI0005A24392|nr:hypothetical protein [Candidatus Azobacteroides pseudotrichonymphae]GMO37848.1 MAG: hypothetical protein Pg6B_09760 [Candidatus Azobacteroides pseudotrichonymphae]